MSNVNSKAAEYMLPEGFTEENGTVYFCHEDDDKKKIVSSQSLKPVAKACNRTRNGNWQIILKCTNHSGAEADITISLKKLKEMPILSSVNLPGRASLSRTANYF